MKRILPLLLVLFVAESASGQLNVWRWQNPPVQGNTLQAVQMVSLQTIFACGNFSTVMRTTDGGLTWDVKSDLLGHTLIKSYNFYALSFLNGNYGMICGDSGKIMKTTDGGDTWNLLTTNTQAKLNSIVVLDTNIAIVIGKSGTILRTLDGGQHWMNAVLEGSYTLVNIRKLRANFITVVGVNGTLLKSVDSGFHWLKIPIQTSSKIVANNFYGQVFIDNNNATLIGELGEIVHTTNGGNLWVEQTVDSVLITASLNQVDGKDPNILAMVGDYGTIIFTTDAGTHWDRSYIPTIDSLRGLSFYDKLTAVVVGKDGIILKTTDGGATWKFLPDTPLDYSLYGVAFPKGDTSLGIAVGYWGTVLRTTNGGTKWLPIGAPTIKSLNRVAFLDPTTLIAVGDYGTIIKSVDAGLSWSKLSSGTTKHLFSVSFPTPNIGWAAGDSGIVISTTDAGVTWTKHPFSKKLMFYGISFSDTQHGYLGSGGPFSQGLFITTDGGVTWDNPDDTYYAQIQDVYSPSPNVVSFIGNLCEPGGIKTSHDGGKTWVSGSFVLPYAVYFVDDMHGTVVGAQGGISHTTDGGVTWVVQKTPPAHDLKGVFFGSTKAGTAVGERGNILRITTNE